MNPIERSEFAGALAGVAPFDALDSELRTRLEARLHRRVLAAGETLYEQGAPGGTLFLIQAGRLSEWTTTGIGRERLLAHSGPGELIGVVALLTGGVRLATVRADVESEVLELDRRPLQHEESLLSVLDAVLEPVAAQRLSKFHLEASGIFDYLDADLRGVLAPATEWVSLSRGEVLFREGEPGDGLYLVAHGRLQVVTGEQTGTTRAVAEIGRGQPVGEMALLVGGVRSATVRALRDTDLVRLSRDSFNAVIEHQPAAMVPLVRTLALRLQATTSGRKLSPNPGCIAVLTLGNPGVDIGAALAEVLAVTARVCLVDAARFDALHGSGSSESAGGGSRALYLREWMSRLEEDNDIVIYSARSGSGAWATRCLAQADRVLLVTAADQSQVWASEKVLLQQLGVLPETELVLLHPARTVCPHDTGRWLRGHSVRRHHHLRIGDPAGVRRLARSLTGRSVGLVLGSGGARGFAHLGALRALQEARLSIDYIGGSSMGALVGALIADQLEPEEILRQVGWVFAGPPRSYRYTLPLVSLMDPRVAEKRLAELFSGRCIEDLWLNYFCVSSNISQARVEIHDSGDLSPSLRASMAIPGLLPPVFKDGDILVDGAMLNNIPCDIMQAFCPGPIVACDVSRARPLTVDPELDRCPGLAEQFYDRLRAVCGRAPRLPGIASILTRSVDCSAAMQKEDSKALAWLYLTPPVESYGMLDMHCMERIVEEGYRYTRRVLEETDLAAFADGV